MWQTALLFPIFILLIKRIETFWFRDLSKAQDIRTYCFKYFQAYILIYLYQSQKEKCFNYWQIFLNYIKCHKDFNTLKLYTLKALLSKNRFYFFLSSSGTQKFHHLLGYRAIGINSSLIVFLSSLRFSNLHIVRLTIWHHLFLEFWLITTWFFAHWRHQRVVTRLENVRQLNIRRCKKLGFHLPHRQPLNMLEKKSCPDYTEN